MHARTLQEKCALDFPEYPNLAMHAYRPENERAALDCVGDKLGRFGTAVMCRLIDEHDIPLSIWPTVVAHLTPIAKAVGGIEHIAGKRMLDLACGAVRGTGEEKDELSASRLPRSGIFEPWLARTLAYLGATVVGIDRGENDREPFTFQRGDIAQEDILPRLPAHSFDVIHMREFLSSTVIWRYTRDLNSAWGADPLSKLMQHLDYEVARLLKPQGMFLISESDFPHCDWVSHPTNLIVVPPPWEVPG